eukprot:GHVP01069422.1.p1 GENE.GHVP01069422.1~~GHVP01069422.1.p1  ORF type:complete len:329 (+),score=49.61 GHVP01069422.1:115-987(+)
MNEVYSDVNKQPISPNEEDINDFNENPVHLGTLKVSKEITMQSLKEAKKRYMLSTSNKQKSEVYMLWLTTMLDLKKIKPMKQDDIHYFGPAVLVPKPNKSLRVTHDFSGLKDQTSLFQFNQTKIEKIWTWAAKQKFLVKLDFIKAFHSVPIDNEDTKFYGFIGPMGTRNSPALFSEFVAKTLNDLMLQFPDNIRFYQDDVAVGASSLRLAGLIENQFLESSRNEAVIRIYTRLGRECRILKSRQKYLGKFASLSNFPGLIAKLAANERIHGPEETSIKILNQLSTTTPDT